MYFDLINIYNILHDTKYSFLLRKSCINFIFFATHICLFFLFEMNNNLTRSNMMAHVKIERYEAEYDNK